MSQPVPVATACDAYCHKQAQADAPSHTTSWQSASYYSIRRKQSTSIRHAPYPTSRTNVCSSTCTLTAPQQQQQEAADGTMWQRSPHAVPATDVCALKQQPLERLLDIAISLASRSLARTMDSFQAACNCWAFSAESEEAARALESAEACMARTIHRMQIAQQLAAAVLNREQQSEQVLQQHQRLHALLAALQGQHLEAVQEGEEEGEEEVCSSWRPRS